MMLTGRGLESLKELKVEVVEEFKGSAQYDSDLSQTYVLAFKKVIEVIEKEKPDFNVGFLRANLNKYHVE